MGIIYSRQDIRTAWLNYAADKLCYWCSAWHKCAGILWSNRLDPCDAGSPSGQTLLEHSAVCIVSMHIEIKHVRITPIIMQGFAPTGYVWSLNLRPSNTFIFSVAKIRS